MTVTTEERYPDPHNTTYAKTIFGFWVFLLTDFMLFATIFVMYAVLRDSTFGGPSAKELFSLPYSFTQALILLASSFTAGLAGIFAHRKLNHLTLTFFGITFVLGTLFMWMEFAEFARLVAADHSWRNSAYLSAYFTLVGTHGFHVFFALLWTIVLIIPVLIRGLTPVNIRRLTCLRMFWQFLNVVWVFVFTIVYLLGAL